MLEELVVQNYAIIDRLQVKFSKGLNVLSGETGAGKSILVGALGLVLGVKADTETIRAGAEETVVSGVIQVAGNPEALDWLEGHGVSPEDQSIIIRRVVKRNGKSSVFIQSSPVTLSALRELAANLFDIHGQHEHQSLLNEENHRKLLDRYGGCEGQAVEFYTLYSRLLKLRDQYSRCVATENERLRQVDLLDFAIKEIRNAKLSPGEDEELEKEQRILSNYERLFQTLETVYTSTAESRGGGLAVLRNARRAMEEVIQIDPGLKPIADQFNSAFYEIEDFSNSIGRYKSEVEFDPARLESMEDRLALIRKLKKKYGGTIEEILSYLRSAQQELEGIKNWEEEKRKLTEEISVLEKQLKQKAEKLTEFRQTAAGKLQVKIEAELVQLGMPKVKFAVKVTGRENDSGKPVYNPSGKDKVEFMISPNPGEPQKRLAQIVSGGEISRIMLAIKYVLAESDHINSLVFDEVDAGIGGEVALSVGDRLKKLSSLKQVLCVTHLATIAVRADNHVKVEKVNKDARTVAVVEKITGEKRREEIARMLAGDRKGETSLMHADELLRKYGS